MKTNATLPRNCDARAEPLEVMEPAYAHEWFVMFPPVSAALGIVILLPPSAETVVAKT